MSWLPSLPFDPGISPIMGWVLAAAAVLITGIAKSGFGGGVGIVAVPLMALAFGAKAGNAILLPILIAADIFSVYHHWGTWNKSTLKILAPGTLTGILVGSLILLVLVFGWSGNQGQSTTAPTSQAVQKKAGPIEETIAQKNSKEALNLITGLVSILYVGLDIVRRRYAPKWHFKPTPATGFGAGAAVGVISTLAHAAGPVAAIFLLNQNMAKQAFIGTTVIYFFAINTIKLIPYLGLNLIDLDTIKTGLWLAPLVPIGTGLGVWMFHRMNEKIFRTVIMVIVFVTGLQMTVETLTGIKLANLVVQAFR